jgi:dTDP-4-dehydrorhamnose 3,5-epimerase
MGRSMKIKPISLPDAYIVEPEPVEDNRGLFSRLFCREELQSILQDKCIAQINHSVTRPKGAIRGMHFQYPPKAEAKMVKCLRGSVFDVIIDLRKDSPAFQKWHGEVLAAENMKMIFIPEGFAHGFQTMEKNCELLYLHTEFYSPEHENGVCYDDPKIGIQWPLEPTEISDKDNSYARLSQDFGGIQLQ